MVLLGICRSPLFHFICPAMTRDIGTRADFEFPLPEHFSIDNLQFHQLDFWAPTQDEAPVMRYIYSRLS